MVGSSTRFVVEVDGCVIRLISGKDSHANRERCLGARGTNIQQSALVNAPTSAQGASTVSTHHSQTATMRRTFFLHFAKCLHLASDPLDDGGIDRLEGWVRVRIEQ